MMHVDNAQRERKRGESVMCVVCVVCVVCKVCVCVCVND